MRFYYQLMNNTYHNQNVHIGHIIMDGVIDSPVIQPWGERVMLIDPLHLANTYLVLHAQLYTVWQHKLIHLNPSGDRIGM